MVTLTIAGIVLMDGIPSMGEFRQNSRMVSTANDLHSSFYLARSEAARAKTFITICASADSMDDPPSCGGEFEDGWIVFVDDDLDGIIEASDGNIVVDTDEAILRRFPARHDSLNIDTTGMGDYFSYAATGLGRGNVTGTPPVTTAIICDVRGNVTASGGRSAARVLVITPLGRATVLRDEDQVTFHGGCP
jgi:type IV fimbrial biogenesis protein FimT